MASIEEIYNKYGQYNTFVCVDFVKGSDSFKKYGTTIYGTFRYTLDQRMDLENAIIQEPIPYTEGNVLFELSTVSPKLSDELKTELDRDGFPINDIDSILSVPQPRKNAFAENGIKEITNILPIEVDFTARESMGCYLGMYQRLISRGQVKHIWQWVEIAALESYLHGEDIDPQIKKMCSDEHLKYAIRYHYLKYKKEDVGLTEDEDAEYYYLTLCRVKSRLETAKKEVRKSGIQYKSLPDELKNYYFKLMMDFEPRIISMGEPIIWIDFERAFHILARHALGLQVPGIFENKKTPFSYDTKNLFQLIHMVVEVQGDEIREELRSGNSVRRMGKRSIEYNGNYYRVEIEPTGRILTFHPENSNM